MSPNRKQALSKVKKVVIKIGSSLLTSGKKTGINNRFLNQLAKQVLRLQKKGFWCVVVTSGAIAAGMQELGMRKRPVQMAKLQALAAVGQSNLMHAYEKSFGRFKIRVAQILLTREDIAERQRYSNAHATLVELMNNRIVPIVNENDTVAVEEIKFGDNDTLGVLVTHLSEADLLILLTDTDGFFSEDPRLNPKAKLLSDIHSYEDDFEKMADGSGSMVGTGGMRTKIKAAKNMMRSGIPMIIASGKEKDILERLVRGEGIGTFFYPAPRKMKNRKRWLAWAATPKGEILVDDGAKKALLEKGRSLLPSGVKGLSGKWSRGETIKIVDSSHREIASGISNFSSGELDQIKGLKSEEIALRLGEKLPEEVVHRNNLAKSL